MIKLGNWPHSHFFYPGGWEGSQIQQNVAITFPSDVGDKFLEFWFFNVDIFYNQPIQHSLTNGLGIN